MTEQMKYPRTPHLPHSPGMTHDDKMLTPDTLTHFQSLKNYIVTEKMDGGNLTWTRHHFFGRSLDSGTHHWDQMAKALWSEKRFDIPEGWRISGESLYARRSVSYDNLPGIYMIIGIWNKENILISWEETEEWARLLDLPHVPVLYRGPSWDESVKVWEKSGFRSDKSEGFVIRNADAFSYEDFSRNIGKYVRANHVQTNADWRHRDDYALNILSDEVSGYG